MADKPDTLPIEGKQRKKCSRCAVEKPATTEFFSPLKSGTFGLHAGCKPCMAAWRRKDRAENKERYALIEKARNAAPNPDRVAAKRERYHRNRDANLAKMRERQQRNRDKYNAARRERLATDPELRARRDARNQRWREENREYLREKCRQRWLSATPRDRLRSYIGAAISRSLKRGGKQGKSWEACVGYSAGDLRAHLERQFSQGMSWDNYGKWHVDHIIPAASFSYDTADDPEFRACWALTNLRPLWATENIRKSDRRVLLI